MNPQVTPLFVRQRGVRLWPVRLRVVRLDEEDIEAIALRVADLLGEGRRDARPVRLLSAAELADVLGVSRSWIYEHATVLGGVRLGGSGAGRRASLRFDLDQVWRALKPSGVAVKTQAAGTAARRRRVDKTPATVDLIEYDGAA